MSGTTTHPASELSSMVTKVAVIEDHREYHEYLTALLNGSPGFGCTGGFRSMEEALSRIGQDLPTAVLVDIGLPGMDGVEGVRLLKERYPEMKLLMLTAYEDDERIFAALCAGASGHLLEKDRSGATARRLAGGGRRRRASISRSGTSRDEALSRNSSARTCELSVDAT